MKEQVKFSNDIVGKWNRACIRMRYKIDFCGLNAFALSAANEAYEQVINNILYRELEYA